MPYQKLITQYLGTGATILCAGFLYWSDQNTQKKVIKKIDKSEKKLAKGIVRVQVLSSGSILMSIDDEAKFKSTQLKLKDYIACVQAGGGEGCIQAVREGDGKGGKGKGVA